MLKLLFTAPLFLTFFVGSLATFVEAKTLQLQPVKMAVNKGDTVQVRGFKGSVEIISNTAAKDVTVSVQQILPDQLSDDQQSMLDEWQFQVRREESEVLITIDGPVTKELWSRTLISNIAPEYHIKLTLPAVPVEVNWSEGKMTSHNHNATLRITQNKGSVEVIGGEGDLHVSNQEGNVKVKGRKGSVDIDAYAAKVDLADVKGQIRVENFIGDTKIEKIEGNLSLSSFRGSSNVAYAKGRLDFKNGNSPLRIDDFQGELRGESLQGPVFAEIHGVADVKVESQEGPVNLRLANSGAWVNLGTNEGSLNVPSFLKLTRLPNKQIRTGRLRGSSGGSVFVRTVSGDVRVR